MHFTRGNVGQVVLCGGPCTDLKSTCLGIELGNIRPRQDAAWSSGGETQRRMDCHVREAATIQGDTKTTSSDARDGHALTEVGPLAIARCRAESTFQFHHL